MKMSWAGGIWRESVLKNCYAPAYRFVFDPSQTKERSSYDRFSPNQLDNTRRLGTKRLGVSFEVAISNERVPRNRPPKTANSARLTSSFDKRCGKPNSCLTRRNNSGGNNSSKTKNSADNRSRCQAMCLCRITRMVPK